MNGINRYSPLGGGATDRKKAKKRHLTEGMTEETLTDLTVLSDNENCFARAFGGDGGRPPGPPTPFHAR